MEIRLAGFFALIVYIHGPSYTESPRILHTLVYCIPSYTVYPRILYALVYCMIIFHRQQVFDCTGRNGWYQANDPNCQLAFYCNAGLAYQHSCPVNQRWNTLSLACDSPDRVSCGSDAINNNNNNNNNAQQPLVPVYNYNPTPGGVPRLGAGAGANVIPPTYPITPFSPPLGTQTYPPPIVTFTPPVIVNNNNNNNNNGGNPAPGYGGDFGTTPRDTFTSPGLGIVIICEEWRSPLSWSVLFTEEKAVTGRNLILALACYLGLPCYWAWLVIGLGLLLRFFMLKTKLFHFSIGQYLRLSRKDWILCNTGNGMRAVHLLQSGRDSASIRLSQHAALQQCTSA